MFGLMQQHELLISGLIEFAQSNHADTEIISRRVGVVALGKLNQA